MNPDQIDTWTDAVLRIQDMVDMYGPGLLLASASIAGWKACRWLCALAFKAWDWAVDRRQLRRTPAAPDNVPPVDAELLIECRRIGRQPLADPDTSRNADHFLRDKQRKEDTP